MRKKFSFTCLEGGGAQKVSDPRFSHFLVPLTLPVIINDRSLTGLRLDASGIAVQCSQ